MQIAQAARRLLAVGLQRIRGEVVLGMALAQLQQFACDKGLGVDLGAKLLFEVGKQ